MFCKRLPARRHGNERERGFYFEFGHYDPFFNDVELE